MVSGSVARRYAKALLAIGHEQGKDEALVTELERLANAYDKNAELRAVLSNPVFTSAQRHAVLDELASRLMLSPTSQNLARLLLARGRMHALPAIVRALRVLVDEQAGRVRVTVTGARPIDALTEGRIRTAIGRATGRMVVLEKREDPALIAGIVAKVGDVVYDGSLAAQIAELRQHWTHQ
jgi:F-type H+-transporting ATPase subunit delta